MSTIWSNFRRVWHAFARARGGNVAVTFAIASIPLIGFVGAAVDYSRANSVKADLQAALDSTALMLSKEAATDSADQLNTNALKYFSALFNRPGVTINRITASYTTTGGSAVTVNGWVDVPTEFIGVLAVVFNNQDQLKNITVYGTSTSKWGTSRLRVALVLDNTGSMKEHNKIGALKTATTNLLTQLQNAVTTDGDVYVSIIPFVKDVSVDPKDYSSSWDSWIDWTNMAPANSMPDANTGPGSACPYSQSQDGFHCVTQPGGSTNANNIPSTGTNAGYICPSNSIGCYTSVAQTTTSTKVVSTGKFASCNGYSNCTCSGSGSNKSCAQTTTGTTYQHTWFVDTTQWDGCFTDRGGSSAPVSDYDRLVTAPSTSIKESLFPPEQYSSCPAHMMGLNYDWTAMNSLVNGMKAAGNTNQPIGLVWGWLSLAGGGPFTVPPMDSNYTYNQVIILLSDGLNTEDRWYNDQTSIDHRMYDTDGSGTCANIKAAGITIYTIQVNTGGDPTSTLLQNCASNTQGTTDHFFLLTSADAIVTTFQTIGTNLTKLRVAN